MKTNTPQEVRPLTAEQLDSVTGGMTATFQYGGFTATITASAGGYMSCTSNGGVSNGCHGYFSPGANTINAGPGGYHF